MVRRPAPRTGPSGIAIKIDLVIEITPRKFRRALAIMGLIAGFADKAWSVIGLFM
ncbi:MAG TPA: hypothetical protein VFU43_11100 [Streptosporangiaceae bacterium]|nr:hypothetical protein [Streptosporangiaceae bacterium]